MTRTPWLRVPAFAVAVAACAGCSVGNLSYAEAIQELDSVVHSEGTGGDERLVYADKAETSRWYVRFLPVLPLKWLLVPVFGSTASTSLENPSGHARELFTVVAEKAGDDPNRAAEVAQRLVRIAELDVSGINRIVALDGIETLADSLALGLAAGVTDERSVAHPPDVRGAAREVFVRLRPAGRRLRGRMELTAEERKRYAETLGTLTARPFPEWQERLALLTDVDDALREEPDGELAEATEKALLAALRHALQWTVVRSMQEIDPERAEVRLRAIDLFHRAGGVDSVPVILAIVVHTPELTGRFGSRFDPDLHVRLRLIHLCGQLNRERAEVSVSLPGREAWERVAPVDFLAEIALERDAEFWPFRTPAIDALNLCLGRERLDHDVAWVQEWYRERRRGR